MALRRSTGFRPSPLRLAVAGALSLGLVTGGGALTGTAGADQLPTLAAAERSAGGTSSASAAPGPNIASAKQRAATLARDARTVRDRHLAAVGAVLAAEADLATLGARVKVAERELASAHSAIEGLASASYRRGGVAPTLGALLVEDPDSALQQASYIEEIAKWQGEALRRMTAARAQLATDQLAMEARLEELSEARSQVAALQSAAERKAADAQRVMAALEAAGKPANSAADLNAAEHSRPKAIATGSCPASGSRGAEARLTPAALTLMRCGLAAFPGIDFAGGYGTRGRNTDHDNGRAVDFMIPNYSSAAGRALGAAVAEWATRQPNLSYVIYYQRIFGSWRGGWASMSNRGSDTENHRDHVHVSVTG